MNTRTMKDSDEVENERKYLIDFVNSLASKYGTGVIENLNYAEKFMHENKSLCGELLNHAESLRYHASADSDYDTAIIVAKLKEKELPIIKNYLQALEAYIQGGSYATTVFSAATKLLKPLPVSDSAKIPDTEYNREIDFVMQLV